MADLLSQYRTHLTRRHLAGSTINRYLTDLRAFARWLDPTPITEATRDQIEVFLDGRDLDAARTRYRWLSELHRFYAWAVAHEKMAVDPTLQIERPRLSRLLPRPIGDDDLARAIEVAGPLMKAWLTLAAYGGLRCAEIATLDRAGLQPSSMRIVGKGGHERVVPLHPQIREALAGVSLSRSGPVFRRKDGRPFTAKEVSRRLSAYLEGIGVDATGHQARHAFGTRAYRHSKNLRAVQELMGHADPSTTASYAAVDADDVAGVIDSLPTL